ncbi:MAG: nucleotidyltransferase family protein [Gammaproteobacteria bacterium]|nr:nucleotidyltransferase family protein [Gammaproteobacteria bacterium]
MNVNPDPNWDRDNWRRRVCDWLRDSGGILPITDSPDLEQLLEFVQTEGVAGILFDAIQTHRQAVPPRLADRLADITYRNAAHALVTQSELRALSEHFAQAGLQPLVIKGAALAHTHYREPYLRPSCDTDLIVDRAESKRLETLLHRLGYRRLPAVSGRFITQQFSMAKNVSGFAHLVDIHIEITNSELFAGILRFKELRASAQEIPALGLWTPHPVAALLLACIHRVVHHPHIERLIWLYDMHLLVAHLPDAEQLRFAELARDKGIASICAASLDVCRSLLGTTLTDPARSVLREAALQQTESSAVYLNPKRTLGRDVWLNLRYSRSWRARFGLIAETLFPPPSYLLGQRPNAHAALLPVYYVSRMLKGAARYVRRRGTSV